MTNLAVPLKGNEDQLIENRWYILRASQYAFHRYGQAKIRNKEGEIERSFYIINEFGNIEHCLVKYLNYTYSNMTVRLVDEMIISLASRQIHKGQVMRVNSDLHLA